MRDPYDVLGLKPGADAEAIKAAYRKLAKELHPDVNRDDSIVEQRFKEVSAAYSFLSDADKKAAYDRGEINPDGSPRFAGAGAGAGPWGPGGTGGFAGFGGAEGEDIFADLFGRRRAGAGGRARTMRMPGKDVSYTVRVSFVEACLGIKRRIKLYDGKSLEVAVPPGTVDRQKLRLKGQGMPGMGGGPAGDAFVEIQVDGHPYFERDGADIFLEAPVSLPEAVLGAKITVPTIHGPVAVNVPKGSNTGTSLRLRGKGVPGPGGKRGGDQYVRLKVVLPDKIDAGLADFVAGWADRNDYDPRRKLWDRG